MDNINKNIFDQYKDPEDRVTLAHAVASSHRLTEDFLDGLFKIAYKMAALREKCLTP